MENGNNNTPDLKDKPEPPLDNKTEVVIEPVPNGKKANESSTNFWKITSCPIYRLILLHKQVHTCVIILRFLFL